MSRLVPARLRGPRAAPEAGGEPYLERVAKYIPVEVVAAYTTMVNVIDGAAHPHKVLISLIALVVCFVFVPFYYYRMRIPTDPRSATISQMVIAAVSFLLWVYALGKGYPAYAHIYDPLVSGLALSAYSLVVGLYEPKRT